MKKVLMILVICSMSIYAKDVLTSVEISDVLVNTGKVHLAIFNSAEGYKKHVPYKTQVIESKDKILSVEVELPSGEYVFQLYQDVNNNGKLDTNLIGMPKEPVGISNYTGGMPSGFDKLKVLINEENKKAKIGIVKL